jgi:hypothetical protein
MKKLFILLFCIISGINAWSQQTTVVGTVQKTQFENTSYLTTGTVTLKPGFQVSAATQGEFFVKAIGQEPVAPSEGQNFVREETIHKSGITTDNQVLALGANDKSTSFSYSDGWGRPLQTNVVQGSPSLKDVISPFFYDTKGRPSKSYLPFRASSTNGVFRTSALTEQSAFYTTPPSGIPADTKPYGETVFEDSPVERALSSKQPGSAYSASSASSKVKVNLASTVRKWTLVNGLPRSTATYPAGTLIISESIDEKGFVSRSYTDFSGKEVLSQSQLTASTWLDTYFVYNGFGELLYMIPPEAAATYSPTQAFADLWYFQYEYDHLGRSTGSKSPGADWIYVIYDQWDRPVLTQDGEQRIKSTPECSNRSIKHSLYSDCSHYSRGKCSDKGRNTEHHARGVFFKQNVSNQCSGVRSVVYRVL